MNKNFKQFIEASFSDKISSDERPFNMVKKDFNDVINTLVVIAQTMDNKDRITVQDGDETYSVAVSEYSIPSGLVAKIVNFGRAYVSSDSIDIEGKVSCVAVDKSFYNLDAEGKVITPTKMEAIFNKMSKNGCNIQLERVNKYHPYLGEFSILKSNGKFVQMGGEVYNTQFCLLLGLSLNGISISDDLVPQYQEVLKWDTLVAQGIIRQ